MNRFASSWFRITRPDDRGEVWRTHGPWVLLTGLVWAVTFLISFETPLRLCVFLRLTGLPCVFCGYTRSFAAISQGEWHFAWVNAPASFVLYAGLLTVLFWNLGALAAGVRVVAGERLAARKHWIWPLGALILLLLANWVYRLGLGMQ